MAKITIKSSGEEIIFLVDGKKITPVYVVEGVVERAAELNFSEKVEFEAEPVFEWTERGFRVRLRESKPPLGVKPCYLVAEDRISELSDGIKRQLGSDKPNYGLVERWANEIVDQCFVAQNDRGYDED